MLRCGTAAEVSPVRNFSAHAVSGRQNSVFTPITMSTITPIARRIAGTSCCSVAAATYDPMPGRA